jgi:hypothetical protein
MELAEAALGMPKRTLTYRAIAGKSSAAATDLKAAPLLGFIISQNSEGI